MPNPNNRGYVEQGVGGLLGLLMTQGATSAENKLLSLSV